MYAIQTAIKVTKVKNVSELNIKHTKRRQTDGWACRKVDKKVSLKWLGATAQNRIRKGTRQRQQ